MVPEISHRCSACGVSIRDFGERILFCPECGKPLAAPETEANNTSNTIQTSVDAPATQSAPVTPDHSPTKKLDRVPGSDKPAAASDGPWHGAREKTLETLHRASTVARGAIEDNVKRVEKIHHVSSVMLEEAAYDPSLRFVLVALLLFVLFIVLLVLSKVMG